ncbi:MAG: GNAT family N-acetyltransferase [Rubrivivax sp.]|nr:GNAT family N-acetyltransferase [Rubrivivax sp.]
MNGPRPLPLFGGVGFHVRELQADEVPRMQAFFEANPEYWLTVNGVPPPPGLAQIEFDERPPPPLTYVHNRYAGLFDEAGVLNGLVVYVEGFTAPDVAHLALFIVATSLRGSGLAQRVYDALEDHLRSRGARWLRLGVVAGNSDGERFWERQGCVELRRRTGVDTGGRINTVRVMLKPLVAGATVEGYLAFAARDRPEPPQG